MSKGVVRKEIDVACINLSVMADAARHLNEALVAMGVACDAIAKAPGVAERTRLKMLRTKQHLVEAMADMPDEFWAAAIVRPQRDVSMNDEYAATLLHACGM
jgi:hypothetical protein